MAKTIPPHYMGLRVSGDLGPVTIYTDRKNRKIFYPIAPPKEPPTQRQLWQRQRFKLAVTYWKQLPPEAKANLEDATRKLGLCLTGQNLFVSCWIRSAPDQYAAVERQSGITLPPLPAFL